ncbi:MAG: energy transducer TonB [Sphingomonadales bacterium]|nr:energy transducer TonB [Sphingomonadales bacterium]
MRLTCIILFAAVVAEAQVAQAQTPPPPVVTTSDTQIFDRPHTTTLPAPTAPTAPSPGPQRKMRQPSPAGQPGNWVTTNDYPALALREQREGVVSYRLTVGPDGFVSGCTITVSSGSADLDATTCRVMTARATFMPATDANGQPTTGTYVSRVRWTIPQAPAAPIKLILPENPMPGQSVITFTIGADGRATDCSLVSGPDPAKFLLWTMPCDYGQVYPVYRDASGSPVARRVRMVLSVSLPASTPPPAIKGKKRR